MTLVLLVDLALIKAVLQVELNNYTIEDIIHFLGCVAIVLKGLIIPQDNKFIKTVTAYSDFSTVRQGGASNDPLICLPNASQVPLMFL